MKTYITRKRALEIIVERNIPKLPRKGRETWTVYAISQNKKSDILGKDEIGFYTAIEQD
jgi:hypothetical protein